MPKPLLTIQELKPWKLYDQVGNQCPSRILYYVDDNGYLWNKDIVANTQHESVEPYNIALKQRFYEA